MYAIRSYYEVRETLCFLRQQRAKARGRANRCLADYVAPADSGLCDHIGLFAVTAGIGIESRLRQFEAAHDDYRAILLKALADRLAEAFAEHLHQRVRREFWGYSEEEDALYIAPVAGGRTTRLVNFV